MSEHDKVIALTERINERDDAAHVWKAVEAIDEVLARYRPEARALAIQYTATILAARYQEALAAQSNSTH